MQDLVHIGTALDLARSPLLASLSTEQLFSLAGIAERRSFKSGQEVFRENEEINAVHVILSGSAMVEVGGELVATLGPGAVLGDHEVIQARLAAIATIRVKNRELDTLAIPRASFSLMFQSEPALAARLASAYGQQLQVAMVRQHSRSEIDIRAKRAVNRLEGQLSSLTSLGSQDEEGETERRFLAEIESDADLAGFDKTRVEQFYVAGTVDGSSEVRLRLDIDSERCTITGKRTFGSRTLKIDLPIDRALYDDFASFMKGDLIQKIRYTLRRDNIEWRVDCFEKPLSMNGRVLAETSDTSENLQAPDGIKLLEEVTEKPEYRNRNLALRGQESP